MKAVEPDCWEGCYDGSWKGLVVESKEPGEGTFAHPAKFASKLLDRIYAHAFAEGWLVPGSVVLDPFGGVALGAMRAMLSGLTWVGVELEEKFVRIGNQNLDLWRRRWGHTPGFGRAVLLQGDSRRLGDVVRRQADMVVSSPPYSEGLGHGGGRPIHQPGSPGQITLQGQKDGYGDTPGQLGAMREGKHADVVVSSPPYADSVNSQQHGIDWSKAGPATGNRKRGPGSRHEETLRAQLAYGSADGQLGAMPEGNHADAIVSLPPYSGNYKSDRTQEQRNERRETYDRQGKGCFRSSEAYGTSAGQLGTMPEGCADAVVSSPPWENQAQDHDSKENLKRHGCGRLGKSVGESYGNTNGQLGNESRETFWSAAAMVVRECHALLRPGGKTIWVVKGFVRAGQVVDFPGQWRCLCEAVGFRFLHEHRAMLVQDLGEQCDLFGGRSRKLKEKKSFFRRIAEKKGAPRIDHETILCLEKSP